MEKSESEIVIQETESAGGVMLPAFIAVAYAIYLFFTAGFDSTNGWLLAVLGVLTITTSGLRIGPFTLIAAYFLGGYQFLIIGLFALGIAISEGSNWGTFVMATFWTLIGWRCLAKAAQRRKFLNAR